MNSTSLVRTFGLIAAVSGVFASSLLAQAPGAAAPAAAGRGARGPAAPALNIAQAAAMTQATVDPALTAAVTAATTALANAAFTNRADIPAKAAALAAADLALANARADAIEKAQTLLTKISPAQAAGAFGGRGGGATTLADFNDHAGWTSLYDGTLNGWSGNTALWKIQDGAILADTTTGSFGTTYLIKENFTVDDFDLKAMVKMGGGVNGGLQFRSLRAPARAGGTDGVTGYQYDFDAGNGNTGALYEQRGRGTVTRPGEMVLLLPPAPGGPANGSHVVLAKLTDLPATRIVSPLGEWNQLELIASGNVITELWNGHVLSVTIDENPALRAYSGILAIEVEAQGQLWMKDIWYKKLDNAGERSATPAAAPAAAPARGAP